MREAEGQFEYWMQDAEEPNRVPKKSAERPVPDEAMREKMDKEVMEVGRLMNGSGAWWQLDGALNISLLKGEYIGTHADVDISVFREDVEKLEDYLATQGYGLFLRKKEEGNKRVYRRVGHEHFNRRDRAWQLRFAAIDEQGSIRRDADLPVIEVAVIKRDKENRPLIRPGEPLPERWLQGKTFDFHGITINLSHPAMFLFYKIWSDRPYDEHDLKELAQTKSLSREDVAEVAEAMEPILKEYENESEEGKQYAESQRERIQRVSKWVDESLE